MYKNKLIIHCEPRETMFNGKRRKQESIRVLRYNKKPVELP